MKTVFMRFVFMCVAAGPFTLAQAQITISQADLSRVFATGVNLINRHDTIATSFNIGALGSGNSWNFAGLLTNTFQIFSSVAASGTPWIGNFPGATNAFRVDTVYEGISGTVFQYLQLNSTGLRNLGNMARASLFPGAIVELRTTVTPAEVVYGIPATMGTVWTTAFTNATRITLNGQDLFPPTTTTHDATYTVDGYGTMQLPGVGNPIHALRIRKLNFYNGSPVLSFIFLSRGGAQVVCEATDTSARSGAINIRRKTLVWNTSLVPDSTTDVRVSEAIPSEFALHQNYPNPFNPTTRITYQVATAEYVSLKVFTLLGKEVASLVNESKTPGTYAVDWNADGLPSGVYFYRMQANGFAATKRLLLLK